MNAFAKNWQDSFTINNLPGALPPMGVWDPLGFSNVDEKTLKRYREAEITHGRVASESRQISMLTFIHTVQLIYNYCVQYI